MCASNTVPPTDLHGLQAPSAWVQRFSALVPAGAQVLDVACGAGRHVRWFIARGCTVTAVDRDAAALAQLADISTGMSGRSARLIEADIENHTWPLLVGGVPMQFDAVVVTQYLWRPLLPTVLASVKPGGVLIYETFARGNEAFGKPSNPEFLLKPGELLQLCLDARLRIVAFEDGLVRTPKTAFMQRICAVRPLPDAAGTTVASMAYPLESRV